MTIRHLWIVIVLGLAMNRSVSAQDKPLTADPAADSASQSKPSEPEEAAAAQPGETKQSTGTLEKLKSQTKEETARIAHTIDQDPNAKTAAAGILQPIYLLAESLAFPAFHWMAFALMAAGVISYTLQLVLGKLIVLTRMGFSLKEIISDAAGLAISLVGLVLTTQAATENSTFTRSPAAVISATVVGLVIGLILYLWGQKQELEAVAGRSAAARKGK